MRTWAEYLGLNRRVPVVGVSADARGDRNGHKVEPERWAQLLVDMNLTDEEFHAEFMRWKPTVPNPFDPDDDLPF